MKSKIASLIFIPIIAFVFIFLAVVPASAAINSQINFQGKITNPDGTNIANGSYSIVFSLYNVASAGTATWAETDLVTVTDGVFQLNLGTTCPFLTASACNSNTPIDFNNSSIFLGVKVGADPEMTPRVSFTASPYAFNSDKVGGLTVSQLVQLSPASQQAGAINVSGNITTAAAAFIQGAATIGSTTGNGQLKFLDGTADGFSGTIQLTAAITANQSYLLPTTGGTICLTTNNCGYATATGGAGYIQNQSVSQQATSNFWISGSGRADTSLLTPSLDSATATSLALGATTATAVNISKTGATTTVAGALAVSQTATVSGLFSANGGVTVAANQNFSLTSGTGVVSQTYSNGVSGNALTQTVTNSNATATATTVTAYNVGLVGATNANAAANTVVGLNLANVTAVANNAFVGINVGTGFNDILRLNGVQLISGSGIIQSAAISGAYANLTGTGALASGSIATGFGTISTANNITTTTTVQGATVNGTTSLNTGATGGTQRIDATGNLTNIGNISTTGASTLTTGGANGLVIKPTTDNATAFQLQTAAGVNFLAFSSSTATLSVGPTTANAGTLNVATGAAVQTVTIGSTNTTSSTALQGGTTGSISIGSTGASTLSSTTNIANTTDVTGTQIVRIGSNSNVANALTLDAGNTGTIKIGNTTSAHTIAIGAGAAAAGSIQTVAIGSPTTTSASTVSFQGGNITTTNNQAGIIVGGGFSTADTNLVGLTLDSTTTLSETVGSCSATVNGGALYYNANAGSNSVRACINGSWEDLISTAGAFLTFFGIVPDSGTVPGDIQGLSTAGASGPCRVSFASATTVNISACTAYSGGRKVTVVAQAAVAITTLNNGFSHVCLNGANNQPLVSTASTNESANLPTSSFPSASAPIVCLADVKTSSTGIAGIYDLRVLTTTTKEFAYAAAALPLGVMVKPDATNLNQINLPGTGASGYFRGIVIASNGAAFATGGPNAIIATAGVVNIKSSAATPLAAGVTIQDSTTVSGYGVTSAVASTMVYGNLGIPQNATVFTCTSAATCSGSFLTDLRIR